MAPTSTSTVVAVFEDYASAERASRELENAGIPRDSVQIQSNFRTGTAGHTGSAAGTSAEHESGFMGWWHRTFGTGGEEPSYATGQSQPMTYDDERGHYAEAVRRGSAVVAVTAAPATLDRAVEILNSAGAVDIDRRVNAYRQEGYQGYDPYAPSYDYDQATAERDRLRADYASEAYAAEGQKIPVIDEELQVGKRVVKRGGVRVYTRVVDQPVDEQINLREEHVRVERRPVDRAVDRAELANLRDQSVEITETAEEAVVSKQARVREEVIVGKETTERTEHIRDNVRHTEVHVDQLGAGQDLGQDGYDERYSMQLRNDPRFTGRRWDEIENDVRADYSRTHPAGEWERMKDRIRESWDRMTSKR